MNKKALRSLLLRVTGLDGRIARKLGNTELHGEEQADEDLENN
jgi:hypothetical protein